MYGHLSRDLIEKVSHLFVDQPADAIELAQRSDNVWQVPFYFIKMVAEQNIGSPTRKTEERDVDLAYRVILQRGPETRRVLAQQTSAFPTVAELISGLLLNPEWRLRGPELISRAFPGLHRVWHPHIPKTAGTSFFAAAFAQGLNFFNTNAVYSASDMNSLSQAFRLDADLPLIISGHFTILQHCRSIAPFDDVISVVRDPVDRAISLFQFSRDVVDQVDTVHAGSAEDVYARGFVYESFEKSIENGFLRPNEQCAFLGREATCSAALDKVEEHNISLVPMEMLDKEILNRFSHVPPVRSNISHAGKARLKPSLKATEQIYELNAEDAALHRVALSRSKSEKS